MMTKKDEVYDLLDRFIFDEHPIRGERVLIENIWSELLLRRNYPKNVQEQLGELLATTALLAATIKIEGRLTVQLEAEGALNLMVVQVNHLKGMRAVARFDDVDGLSGLKELCGAGRIVITIDAPTFKHPYQGVIPLQEESIAKAIEYYFETSEQLDTRLYLAASDRAVAGMLLQRLPGEMHDEDAFNRVTTMAETLQDDELLTLETEELLYRLYSEDQIRLFDPDRFHYECNCSKDRSLMMLYQLESKEVREILAERDGALYVDCEFCGKRYLFDESEIDFDAMEQREAERAQKSKETIH